MELVRLRRDTIQRQHVPVHLRNPRLRRKCVLTVGKVGIT